MFHLNSRRQKIGIFLLSVGVFLGLVVVAINFSKLLNVYSLVGDCKQSCGAQLQMLNNDEKTLRRANLLGVASVLTAATGGYLIATGRPKTKQS